MPYEVLAGVEPCRGGWVVMAGKLQGTNVAPEAPQVFASFKALIDWKPAFQLIAIHAPLGLPSKPAAHGRTCDREARALLGWPRSAAVVSAPTRRALRAKTYKSAAHANAGLSPVVWQHFDHYRQVADEMAPYWQRTIFEVNPELGFFNLNGDSPLLHGKNTPEGITERRALLERGLPGIERVIADRVRGATAAQVIAAGADLWTARRLRSRAATRMPLEPEWDDQGIRMEIWR